MRVERPVFGQPDPTESALPHRTCEIVQYVELRLIRRNIRLTSHAQVHFFGEKVTARGDGIHDHGAGGSWSKRGPGPQALHRRYPDRRSGQGRLQRVWHQRHPHASHGPAVPRGDHVPEFLCQQLCLFTDAGEKGLGKVFVSLLRKHKLIANEHGTKPMLPEPRGVKCKFLTVSSLLQ